MWACTLLVETPARRASSERRRDVSSTVPEEKTRERGRPETREAITVITSQGFVTRRYTASGASSRRPGIIDSMIPALTPARSVRDWPGRCLAPAVMTTTCEPSATRRSDPPLISLAPVNWVPCARSSTSASTRSAAMS